MPVMRACVCVSLIFWCAACEGEFVESADATSDPATAQEALKPPRVGDDPWAALACGDGVCAARESCATCQQDCGACPCGDGICEQGESCQRCPLDCGECASCGNGTCSADESCDSCPADCGVCDPGCGDGVCEFEEVCACEQDCGGCPPKCGDGVCARPHEDCTTCIEDCSRCDGDCCEAHPGFGCRHPEVVDCVCAMDAFCCDQMWDTLCAEQAASQCTTCDDASE